MLSLMFGKNLSDGKLLGNVHQLLWFYLLHFENCICNLIDKLIHYKIVLVCLIQYIGYMVHMSCFFKSSFSYRNSFKKYFFYLNYYLIILI